MINTQYLTERDIHKVEEALNTTDLETMVATVDRIVELRVRAARKAAALGLQKAQTLRAS